MAYTTVNKSSSFHEHQLLYTGKWLEHRQLTGVGFQPDWTWIKARNGTYNHHILMQLEGNFKK